jgi:hypothetical protein
VGNILKASRVIPLAALLCAVSASAGVNEFTHTGVDGGYIDAIAAQPGNPSLVLVASPRGIHRSTDSGLTWTTTAPTMTGRVTHIAFDPVTPSRAYALNGQLYRSADAGQTFTPTTDVAMNFAHLAISGSRIYVGAYNGTIYRSSDGASTWTPLTVPWASPTARMHTMGADPANNGALYACVEGQGIYKSIDHGANWINPPAGINPCSTELIYTTQIEVSPADANRIIASTMDGIFLSTNGSASWTRVSATQFPEWVKFDPLVPNNVFSVEPYGRVIRSSDGGATWPPSSTGPSLKLDRVEGAAFAGAAGHWYIASPNGPMYSTDNGHTFTLRTTGIHAAQVYGITSSDDGTIYATQLHGQAGIHRRSGATWVPLDNTELQSRLLNHFNILEIATSPENSSLLYAADQLGGLFRSVNGGVDWIDPPPSLSTQISGVVVDPTNPLRAYANNLTGGMMRTIDGGLTYTACGLSNALFIRNVVVDRSSPDTLYGIAGYGPVTHIMKSTDSCGSWTDISSQLPYYFNHLAVDPADHRKVWLAHYGGVERSYDGGATWETVQFNFEQDDYVLGFRVLFDPLLPSTVWVLNANFAGFARSVDDGATWQRVAFSLPGNPSDLRHGVLDPLWPDTLVAGATGYGVVEYQVAPDLEVTLDAPSDGIPTGTTAALTVNLRNLGPLDASAADVTLMLPAYLTVPSPPAGCALNASTVRCRATALRVGQTRAIALTLMAVAAPGSGSIAVSVAGHEADPVSTNNSASAAVSSVRRAELVAAGTLSATIGRTTSTNLDFTLINQGPDDAQNARVSFSIPAGLQATAGSSPAGPCTVTAALVTCSLGTLSAKASTTAQVRVQGMTHGTHNVSAQLVSDSAGAGQRHTAITVVVVQALADFAVEVAAASGTHNLGTAFPFTVTVRNLGPDAGPPRVDMILTGASVVSAVPASGTCAISGVTLSCQLAELANGTATTVTLTVNPTAAGATTAEAVVSFAGSEAVTSNNRATQTATVVAPASPGGGGSSSGGGGGGGRFDWLGALLLGGLLTRRAARS